MTEDDDIDIDVCQHCGRYFAWSPQHAELSRKHGGEGWNPQRCIRCITNETWIEDEAAE